MAEGARLDDLRPLLARWRQGDASARDEVFALTYPELRLVAAAMLRGERGTTVSTRDLVHEVVLRLVALDRIDWEDRNHFLALAARMMRRALVDHARARDAGKRRHHRVELVTGIPDAPRLDVADLAFALDRLAAIDPERAEIVEMRFFGGMEVTEVAQVLGTSEATVKRRWSSARLWLADALGSPA